MIEASYEALRDELQAICSPSGEVRNLRWLAPEIAVGRNATADFEVFLNGPELIATSPLVTRHIQHGEWRPSQGGTAFSASRIILPSAPHFASVAALIAVELIRAGIAGSGNPQPAFTAVEPIIEMAIRRGALPENVIIGLIGELSVLRQCLLVTMAEPARRSAVLDSWRGWQTGGRDFRFGADTIEVKTTQAVSSIHEFSGLHQLEEERLPDGGLERLHLLSIGLTASTAMGETLPSLVGDILAMLAPAGEVQPGSMQTAFLTQVEAYGSQNGTGYAHETMRDWSAYNTRYTHSFAPRLYRTADPAMLLLRRETLASTFVQPSSISFTMHFPDQVSTFNPAPNWQEAVASIVRR